MSFPRKLLDTYFNTFDYPFVRHHIDSYDQFLTQDVPAIIRSNNPFLLLKQARKDGLHKYRVEIYIGGVSGTDIEIGTPTLTLQKTQEIRVLFPNEARLRNLTYSSTVYASIYVRVTIASDSPSVEPTVYEHTYPSKLPIFQIPILLHSRFCILHGKPASFLQEAGECHRDQGGYFIVDGSEKVLVTRQEQAFNTLYITPQKNDPQVSTYANITCLSPVTRQVKVVSFSWMRKTNTLCVNIPFVRLPVPIFVLFRAMGVQSDKDILRLIFPDLESGEATLMIPYLLPSIAEAVPFLDTFSAIQFIRVMTKGFSIHHVYDILFNKVFVHITDTNGGSRVHFLAECVRRILRVQLGLEPKSDRDDTRNQRCLTSGLLIRMLFNGVYPSWKKAVRLTIDKTYEYNKATYSEQNFMKIFKEGNVEELFNLHVLTEGIMKGFKGKWVTGGAGGGGALGHSDEKSGVLQALSRISYLDFMSHCRRVSLNFDTGMKLTGPRQLHPSQYGFFCTNETPGGASIGIAKNLSTMTLISSSADPEPLMKMLVKRGWVLPCSEMNYEMLQVCIPVYINDGILGYTLKPFELTQVLKTMKWTGCLPALCSVGFSIKVRRVFVYLDEGRPCRPLIHLGEDKRYPKDALEAETTWRDLVLGTYSATKSHGVSTATTLDPFADLPGVLPLEKYEALLKPMCGLIEYVDPYEQNELLLVSFPEEIVKETTHIEVHPSTILSVVNSMIPFANFNQSPRNQLSCSQSKQGLSLYATNFQNRYDNSANILCYGEAPLVRTYIYDKLGAGSMPYGHNLIMAIMSFQGYNQDDGIIFNEDAFQRGQFRSINYRSYTTYEEVDPLTQSTSTIGHPSKVPRWTDLRPGIDYTQLDDRGIIKEGSIVNENTVLVGKYVQDKKGNIKDASLTPQVWTSGRVESVVITVNPKGFSTVKVRITQDRIPEFGDKFSTRHGQKGTIGMIYRAQDMPRTADGVVPDMIVNPHCIPSRMTIAQLMEMLFGWVCYKSSTIGDATTFTTDSNAHEHIGKILEEQYGMERGGNTILYDGATGVQMKTNIFIGPVFVMRLKHMVEDKWNARAEGRKEQKTRQPTGGRGAQGGLRIGEMERDALVSHGVSGFLKESMMERADKAQIRICNGCGTVPIFNQKQSLFVCPLCDGPPRFIGATTNTLEILPTMERSSATTSIVEMPYATKLLGDELQTYLNMGMRILTAKSVSHLEQEVFTLPEGDLVKQALEKPLPQAILVDTRVPKYEEAPKPVEDAEEDLFALGHIGTEEEQQEEQQQEEQQEQQVGPAFGLTPPYGGTPQESTTPQYRGTPEESTTPQYAPNTPQESTTPQYGYTPPYAPNTPPYAPNALPVLTLQQPVYISQGQPQQLQQQQQAPFPSGMNSPAYAPTTPVAEQNVGGVPQVIQRGGFQSRMVQEPFSRSHTIVIDGGIPAPAQQSQRGSQRQTRPSHSGGKAPAPQANPSARITIRKIG
jgi:DNA-directed RNA polymerase II subunit RPB2